MATFSTNQVRNLFIIDQAGYTAGNVNITDPTTLGSLGIALDAYPSSNTQAGAELAFIYKSLYGDNTPSGNLLRSDLIQEKKVKDIRYIASTGTYQGRVDTVTITNAVPGQDYIIRITFSNWGSGSAEDQYFIYAHYRALSADTPTTIAAALAENLEATLGKEAAPYFTVTAAGAAITITELEAPFVLGKKSGEPYVYTIQLLGINDANGLPVEAGTSVITTQRVIPSGYGRVIADMEWFYAGERGDIYRGKGYPHNFISKYAADPTVNYDVLEIKFYWSGDNEAVQESVKQITIAAPTGGTALTDLVADIEANSDLTVTIV